MNNLDKKNFKIRLLKLALLKSTGTPADLAFRFGISDRSVKRIVSELRDEGVNIKYSKSSMTYLTDETAKKYLKHVV
jgi:biotin operon repressor